MNRKHNPTSGGSIFGYGNDCEITTGLKMFVMFSRGGQADLHHIQQLQLVAWKVFFILITISMISHPTVKIQFCFNSKIYCSFNNNFYFSSLFLQIFEFNFSSFISFSTSSILFRPFFYWHRVCMQLFIS